MRLTGKTALVTAAGQGIGRATEQRFAAEGAEVIATGINPDTLTSLDVGRTTVLDVTDDAAVAGLAADVGAVDVLFNCAGFVHHGTILDCAPDDWAFSLELNVTSM